MKKFLVFTFISILFSACSSPANAPNNIVDKISPNTNVSNANVIQNNNVPVINSANTADANLGQMSPQMNRKMQKMTNSASNTSEKPKITYIPAAHNSGVATRMGDNGEFIQIRVFNSDAQIKSIEQIVTTDKLKISLKNGKVMEVTVDKDFTSEKFVSISPQEILVLAGLAKKQDDSQTGSK